MVNLGESISFKPFSFDDLDMLDETLEDFISPKSSIKALVQEDAYIENNENHGFSSLNTSPTCDERILVLEDPIIEHHAKKNCLSFNDTLLSANTRMDGIHEDVKFTLDPPLTRRSSM